MGQRCCQQVRPDDREFAYGVLRAWAADPRDRSTRRPAHLVEQLPDLIRGVFYAVWDPSAVPEKYDAEAYARRFAARPGSPSSTSARRPRWPTAADCTHLPAAHIDKALNGFRLKSEPYCSPGVTFSSPLNLAPAQPRATAFATADDRSRVGCGREATAEPDVNDYARAADCARGSPDRRGPTHERNDLPVGGPLAGWVEPAQRPR